MIDIKQKIFRYLYNNLKPSDIEKKEEIIKKLFAKTENQIIVEQNFDNKNHKIIHVFKICIIFLIFYTCSFMHILINAVTINEAKDSSAIENIVTTHDDIYKVLTESGYKEENAKEVVDYRNAIWLGYEQIKKDEFINTNTIVKIQGTIEHNNAGIRKLPSTELKNSITGETIYTPPQNEKEIREYLKNLEDFINNNEDGIDPLIKVCLIHYQFESIHPFYDGNGRTGRILNILYLVLNNLIDSPILYLSKYINKTKQEYYKLFNEVRKNNNFEDWILYILKGIEITSKETIELIEKIQTEMKNYKEEFRSKLPKIYSKELLESLYKNIIYRKNM